MARREQPVARITTAPETHGFDVASRQRRYLISMAARTVCFIGAVAVGPGVLRWVCVVGAVFLPYIAVIMANQASPRPAGDPLETPGPTTHHELSAREREQ